MLDTTDWRILFEYDRDPFQSYNAISKIVGVHHSTVADRINSMKNKNVLRPDGMYADLTRDMLRPTSEVIGKYSPASLGLERIHVLFKRIGSKQDYNLLESFCDAHPYTHYYTRLYGSGVTLYAQFDIPENTIDLHRETFNKLVNEYIEANKPEIFRDQYEARAIPNYKKARNLQRAETSNIIEILWDDFINNLEERELKKPEQGRSFDNIDAELIRELTINGKTKITELTDHFDLNKSTLSRRMARIRENYVLSGQLLFGATADKLMGFNNTQIVTGTFTRESPLRDNQFVKFINSDNLHPFEAFITVDQDRFLLYTQSSVGIAGDMMDFLYNNTNPYDLNQYQFYISEATIYPFYHGNYDETEGFTTSKDYIMDNELQRIDNYPLPN